MSIFKEHKTSADRSATDRRRHKKKIEDAEAIKSKIDGTSIEINIEANDEGVLYGSITQKQIAEAFNSKDIEIKSDMVALSPIKSLGEFEIKIKHYEEVESQIKVLITRKS